MGYGLRVFSALGKILLDTTDRISRFIWNSEQTSGSSEQLLDGSDGLPDIRGISTVEFSIGVDLPVPSNPTNCYSTAYAYREGATIKWQAYSTNYQAGNCIIFVFAYT